MLRLFFAFAGLLVLGAIGAFFLFVPILTIATVTWVLAGLLLMFGLGVQVGTREMQLVERAPK